MILAKWILRKSMKIEVCEHEIISLRDNDEFLDELIKALLKTTQSF